MRWWEKFKILCCNYGLHFFVSCHITYQAWSLPSFRKYGSLPDRRERNPAFWSKGTVATVWKHLMNNTPLFWSSLRSMIADRQARTKLKWMKWFEKLWGNKDVIIFYLRNSFGVWLLSHLWEVVQSILHSFPQGDWLHKTCRSGGLLSNGRSCNELTFSSSSRALKR